MRKSRFSEEQMVTILREADKTSVVAAAKKHKVSEQTLYAWRKHFGELQLVAEAGIHIASGKIEIDARSASTEEARALGIEAADPILERRVMFAYARNRCFMTGTSRYPSGKTYSFEIEFRARPQTDSNGPRLPRKRRNG